MEIFSVISGRAANRKKGEASEENVNKVKAIILFACLFPFLLLLMLILAKI